jgi:hypothetical protein
MDIRVQAKPAPQGSGNAPKTDIDKGQDQIHRWLIVYAQSRDPALRDAIIQSALPLVKRIAYGLARRSGLLDVLLTRSRI